jgi:hypothetical protein
LTGLACDACKVKIKSYEDPAKEIAKDAAKEVGKKVGKMVVKNYNDDPDYQTRNIQNGIKRATSNPAIKEYKDLEEQNAKRCDDSVNPVSHWIRNLWDRATKAVSGE